MRVSPHKRAFLLATISLCLLYFVFEFFFNRYAMFSADEFWVAHHAYQFKTGLPYRDFSPYKTVLGYYVLLLPMLISHGLITTLTFMKNSMALLNAIVFFAAACWLTRFFSQRAIIASLSLLLMSEMVLVYSTNIRIDLMAYWLSLFSLLLLLEKRYTLAGILLGLGFAASQKVIWYLAASNIAFLTQWCLLTRDRNTLLAMLRFNLTVLLLIVSYVLFWSMLAGWHSVLHNVFYEATLMYALDWYAKARQLFWSIITIYNPLLILLWPFTLMSLAVTCKDDHHYQTRFFVTIYALTILAFLIPYKQIFPYYMQVTYPVLLVLYAAFFDWLIQILKATTLTLLINRKIIYGLMVIYLAAICYTNVFLHLPLAYLLIIALPVSIGLYCLFHSMLSQAMRSALFNIGAVVVLFLGFLYPLSILSAKMINLNGQYQKILIQNMQTLLTDNDGYVAGIELMYDHTQPVAGLRHLMGTAVDYLYSPTEKLRRAMLTSLYEDPNATIQSVIQHMEKEPVKFYVNNYRVHALPPAIKTYLAKNYKHFWGSIYLYAPQIAAKQHPITVKFSGNYAIDTGAVNAVMINGKVIQPHTVIYLKKGNYLSTARESYRLVLIPPTKNLQLNESMRADEWEKVIF